MLSVRIDVCYVPKADIVVSYSIFVLEYLPNRRGYLRTVEGRRFWPFH